MTQIPTLRLSFLSLRSLKLRRPKPMPIKKRHWLLTSTCSMTLCASIICIELTVCQTCRRSLSNFPLPHQSIPQNLRGLGARQSGVFQGREIPYATKLGSFYSSLLRFCARRGRKHYPSLCANSRACIQIITCPCGALCLWA